MSAIWKILNEGHPQGAGDATVAVLAALRAEMARQGVGARALAARLGCSPENVRQHLQGGKRMRLATVERIAAALGLRLAVELQVAAGLGARADAGRLEAAHSSPVAERSG